MPETQPNHEKVITTHRSPERLARLHGFKNIAQLAASLPEGANVLDVGAGTSLFGNAVAQLRPDVAWVNFDYSYYNPDILEHAARDAPANLLHRAGDATQLDALYQPESFDAVFSYWLLPHLSLSDSKPAQQALRAMFALTKTDGLLSIGPDASRKRLPLQQKPAIQTVKSADLDASEYVERVVAKTKLSKLQNYGQSIMNTAATDYFGTSLYTISEGHGTRLYDPKNSEYIHPFSRRGVVIAGELAVALAREAKQMHKTN